MSFYWYVRSGSRFRTYTSAKLACAPMTNNEGTRSSDSSEYAARGLGGRLPLSKTNSTSAGTNSNQIQGREYRPTKTEASCSGNLQAFEGARAEDLPKEHATCAEPKPTSLCEDLALLVSAFTFRLELPLVEAVISCSVKCSGGTPAPSCVEFNR